jgi:hypothetical protein
MSPDDITAVLIDELGRVAPETGASEFDPGPICARPSTSIRWIFSTW